MYNKTVIRFSFCDIQNNQGLCKGYQPQASVLANPYLDFDYSGCHKTSSNNCSLANIANSCHNSTFVLQLATGNSSKYSITITST